MLKETFAISCAIVGLIIAVLLQSFIEAAKLGLVILFTNSIVYGMVVGIIASLAVS